MRLCANLCLISFIKNVLYICFKHIYQHIFTTLFRGLVAGLLRPRLSLKRIEQSSNSGKFRERHFRCMQYKDKCMCNAQKYHGKHVNLKSIYFYSTQFCSRSSSWKAYPLVINIPVNQKPENSHQRCCI